MRAREKVLDEHNLFPAIAKFAKENFKNDGEKRKITLRPFKYRFGARIQRYLKRKKESIQNTLMRLRLR